MNILIIFAHPYPHQSKVNLPLLNKVRDIPGVEVLDLYEHYPDFYINVPAEQKRLRKADLIIFQHPFYWYSAPALLKHWQDTVLQEGFALGENGVALHGKKLISAVTVGHTEHAYQPDGYDRYCIEDYLRPYEQMAFHCGMDYLPPFVVYSSHHLSLNEIEIKANSYHHYLLSFLPEANDG